MNRVLKHQILEWIENPVTLAFKDAVEKERDEMMSVRGLECFQPFEPQKTQELMSALNGAVDTWNIVFDTLEGEGLFEEEEDEDGDISER